LPKSSRSRLICALELLPWFLSPRPSLLCGCAVACRVPARISSWHYFCTPRLCQLSGSSVNALLSHTARLARMDVRLRG
ncbi:hypothetical protein C8R43DRAFT_1007341, partial [Mycena crocata]